MLGELLEGILKNIAGVLILRLEEDGSYSIEVKKEAETDNNTLLFNADNIDLAVYALYVHLENEKVDNG